ncbi:hypothetical protein psal_cds_241 [Pandoravirus salinus]|uniref:Uncharacterized protein n=1 Tax=Pandoravirus salinus TaxID=1349410 RepID=S4VTX2_9VIRU|nr:hypothetical protein psal_cds_241 [Pandoravirus salinus]AGO83788.1 hypothetical protein psal_cds_241 [Pandoravirus salinus]
MECQTPVDDVILCAPPEPGRMQVERRIEIGPSAPFVVLKVALFLLAVILLGGAVVFAFKVVGMLVDAGTKAVDRTLAARDLMPLPPAYNFEPQQAVCSGPQAGDIYYSQQWTRVFVDPRTDGDSIMHF